MQRTLVYTCSPLREALPPGAASFIRDCMQSAYQATFPLLLRRISSAVSSMEKLLKKELGTSKLVSFGHAGGGCISDGRSYDTDTGRIFVKVNTKSEVIFFFCQW